MTPEKKSTPTFLVIYKYNFFKASALSVLLFFRKCQSGTISVDTVFNFASCEKRNRIASEAYIEVVCLIAYYFLQ